MPPSWASPWWRQSSARRSRTLPPPSRKAAWLSSCSAWPSSLGRRLWSKGTTQTCFELSPAAVLGWRTCWVGWLSATPRFRWSLPARASSPRSGPIASWAPRWLITPSPPKVTPWGAFFLAQASGKVMTSRRTGRIVNIASIFGLVGGPNRAAYSASKGGLVNLTRSLAVEWAPFNVQVNAVAPNVTRTPMTEKLLTDPSAVDAITTETPAGRLATTQDVGDAVAWLAVSAPSYITGVTLPVDGGWTAK